MKEEWIVELTESDSEIWSSDIDCKSREEAVREGLKYAKKDSLKSFRIGRVIPCGIPNIDTDWLLEKAQEELYDEVGESSEVYLDGDLDFFKSKLIVENEKRNKKEVKPLTEDKKKILEELMGSASSKQIDFNKVRDEWGG